MADRFLAMTGGNGYYGAMTHGGHHFARIGLLTAVVLAGFVVGPIATTAAEPPTPAEVLMAKGLTRVGTTWHSSDEMQVRRLLTASVNQEKRLREVTATFEKRLEPMLVVKSQLGAAEEKRKLAREALTGNLAAPRRRDYEKEVKDLTELIQRLRPQADYAVWFDDTAPLKISVLDLINARNVLTLSTLELRRRWEGLDEGYRALKEDAEVAAALKALGSPHRLGFAGALQDKQPWLARIEDAVLTPAAPIYRDGDNFRLSMIVNETAPATFTYFATGRNTAEATIVPASLVDNAGIKIPADSESRMVQVGGNRRLSVRLIKLPTLRVGRHVIRDAPAFVLPPEGEDLGAQLGPEVFRDYQVALDADRLAFKLEPKHPPAPKRP